MKTMGLQDDTNLALDQFRQLACDQQGALSKGLSRMAMLMAVGRYCRHRHLSIGRQSTFQRKFMDQESHHEC
ncbi:MAG: hypothetical protein CMI01_10530 [Oceanospirillaceae bacterium]|jgi:hypothetical protein|uniref:hypothetical protein n=1 Tax=Marinobacterium litorale TaxID=404770 RepID=UPI00040189AD|nr:hypothetical protein [Marinobacterium litorale]MBS99099.1 hypothetical protein [Oceanospirillaceae bacterium]